MNFNLVIADKWFRRALLSLALVLAIAEVLLPSQREWLKAFFVIVMAGIVGYFTNFLAIKMLFQPKKGKVLGWEGLVPKNKAQIARSLGESVQNNLLSPTILMQYIYERNLIENMTQKVANWVDSMLAQEEQRAKLTGFIVSYLREKGPDMLNRGFDFT